LQENQQSHQVTLSERTGSTPKHQPLRPRLATAQLGQTHCQPAKTANLTNYTNPKHQTRPKNRCSTT